MQARLDHLYALQIQQLDARMQESSLGNSEQTVMQAERLLNRSVKVESIEDAIAESPPISPKSPNHGKAIRSKLEAASVSS